VEHHHVGQMLLGHALRALPLHLMHASAANAAIAFAAAQQRPSTTTMG